MQGLNQKTKGVATLQQYILALLEFSDDFMPGCENRKKQSKKKFQLTSTGKNLRCVSYVF